MLSGLVSPDLKMAAGMFIHNRGGNPRQGGRMKKFERAAVLSDKIWLKKISELEGLFYPGLEIKAFDRDQRAESEDWLPQ